MAIVVLIVQLLCELADGASARGEPRCRYVAAVGVFESVDGRPDHKIGELRYSIVVGHEDELWDLGRREAARVGERGALAAADLARVRVTTVSDRSEGRDRMCREKYGDNDGRQPAGPRSHDVLQWERRLS